MSLNPTQPSALQQLEPPRDSSSVGSSLCAQNTTTVLQEAPDDTLNTSNKKRKTDEVDLTVSSSSNEKITSLSSEHMKEIEALVDTIVKELKVKRKCNLARLHYEEYAKGTTFPKDIDVDIKFGNPYPKAVSTYCTFSMDSLAQQEKSIWNKAKAEIVALRLNALNDTHERAHEMIAALCDPRNIASSVNNLTPDLMESAMQTFEKIRETRLSEVATLFQEQDKAFAARQEKRLKKLQKQQEAEAAMVIDESPDDETNPTIKKLKDEMSALKTFMKEEILSLTKQLADMNGSNRNRKNDKAPERNGHGNPVLQQMRRDNNAPHSRRPNQEARRPTPYKDALNRSAQMPQQRQQQVHRRGRDRRNPQTRNQQTQQEGRNRSFHKHPQQRPYSIRRQDESHEDGQWILIQKKNRKNSQNPKMQNGKGNQNQNQRRNENATANANRGKR